MPPAVTLVDNFVLLNQCIANIAGTTKRRVTDLAIDLEGVQLSREGRVSLMQVMANTSEIIWVIDVTVLGATTFIHSDSKGRNLKSILESTLTTKLLYDARQDADALYNLFDVDLTNVYDIQLLEVASRRARKLHVKLLSGLGRAIQTYIKPPANWIQVKEAGAKLCFPDKGGSYDAVEKRPLDPRMLAYSAQDVELLFQLRRVLEANLGQATKNWIKRVKKASAARVKEAHGPFKGRGPERALAPQF